MQDGMFDEVEVQTGSCLVIRAAPALVVWNCSGSSTRADPGGVQAKQFSPVETTPGRTLSLQFLSPGKRAARETQSSEGNAVRFTGSLKAMSSTSPLPSPQSSTRP